MGHRHFYDEHAKTCSPVDFWGQVKRTVNGTAIGEDQISLIVNAISDGLQITESDVLLDICCGNGVLTDLLFARCNGGVGVDIGDYLIRVAKKHFERAPQRVYQIADVEAYLSSTPDCARFTKVLCYSAMQYFPSDRATALLTVLRQRFQNVQRVFLGNMPDKAKIRNFYYEGKYVPGVEDDLDGPLGLWRTRDEVSTITTASGWTTAFYEMPQDFHGAHYRFDAVLAPPPQA